jgi:hypothetical protein
VAGPTVESMDALRAARAQPLRKDSTRVRMNGTHSESPGGTSRCLVAGHAACRMPLSELQGLRQVRLEMQGKLLPANFFKHSDEQTIAAMHAAARVVQGPAWANEDFQDWGAVACPRFFARAPMAAALQRYEAEGAWGISPHLIPHRSLHTVSGTLSQALKIHGPNYGVGGGTDGAAETLLAAAALLAGGTVRGVWVLLTGFDPEVVPIYPFSSDSPAPASDCVAVALALRPAHASQSGLFLEVGMDRLGMHNRLAETLSLEKLAAVLHDGPAPAEWKLNCGGWCRLEFAGAAVEICQ